MNGAYTRVLCSGVWTVECDFTDAEARCTVVEKKRVELENDNQYHLFRYSKGNKACPDLVRSIFLLRDKRGDIMKNTVLLRYHITSGVKEVKLQVLPHGNAKRTKNVPFYPTAKSTMEAIKDQLKQKPSMEVYKVVSRSAGGPSGANTVGELPRSQKQIYDLQFNSKREKDPVDDFLLYARHKEDKIVLRHEDMPLDLWVLGTEVMCHDIVRFSCSDKLSYPISIDPTFNMGQYEVTPVVYKHLFLTSKRYGQSPVFLGPTMLHHKKNFDTYKVLFSTTVGNCKGLSEAKGYITDGEEELDRAWKTELTKATHLRCIRHFEGNCKQKLCEIGISDAKNQKWFLEKVFGVPGKVTGVVDLESKKEVKKEILTLKEEMDMKECELLQKNEHEPQFSTYLYERRNLIGKTMSQKARRKAATPVGLDGKSIRPYTNASEAMKHMMRVAKEVFLREHKMPTNSQLSKLQFTKHVFEELHLKQQQELTLAVNGLSNEYQLSMISAHLAVPPEVWFEWPESERKDYIRKFNLMSVDEALKQKSIKVNTSEPLPITEDCKELSAEISSFLVQKFDYVMEIARAVEDGALMLLNSPAGIQKQPTLDQNRVVKYEVASKAAKHGRIECTANKNHVSCRCSSFKADRVCKHSIAVAEKVGMLNEHLKFIGKNSDGSKCS